MPKKRQLNRIFRRSALTLALGVCFSSQVVAQSNTAGAVFGQVNAGDTVLIENPDTGFQRRVTASSDGSYRASAIPTGVYRVTVERADGTTQVREGVRVNVGTGTDVNFAAPAGAGGDAVTLASVQVVGSAINPIDVSSVESSTILTSEQLDRIPVPRDVSSVALLAPGTVKGDSAFGNLASFGGSSVAENQYYVNGLNITNSFKNLNFAQLPFEAIAEQQVKTGGYGAEFGRSTGGVINLITKRGTNEFFAGGNVYWTPESLKEDPHNEFYNDGRLVADNSRDKGWEYTASIWAGGALVQDRLFAYALLQYGEDQDDFYPRTTTGGSNDHRSRENPKWLLKMDWNINDNNLLELTAFSDKRDITTDSYDTIFVNDTAYPERGDYLGTNYEEEGGTNYALKYTGYLSDTFTLSALAGRSEFSRSNYAINALGIRQEYTGNLTGEVPGCPIIVDARQGVLDGSVDPIVGCDFLSTLGRIDAEDQRDQYRLDAEWVLGDHVIRGGIDIDDFTTVDGSSYSGGAYWRYYGNPADNLVRLRDFRNGATVEVNSTAYYIEDSWSITNNLIAYLGLRWDSFENKNGSGETYVEIKNQFAPRLGLSWDVFGDSSFKVFANAGRYALPLTANVAIRGASASLYSESYYTYTGVDPVTGAPTGLTLIPHPLTGGDVRYLNNEFGAAKDPRTIAQEDLDPMYQDEYIVGFQKQLTDNFSIGLRATYRDLKAAIDDQCDYRPIFEWAEENGYEINDANPGFPYCRLYNPGRDAVFNMDVDGDGTLERIPVPADVLGPDVKRTYKAAEIFWQGNWDRFFLQGSYTYSKSYGNTEGGVKSDIGQDATGTTQDFDYPELAIGSEGYLPNDRRHSLKLFGSYDVTDEWTVGANLLVQSGRPVNCFGFLGGWDVSHYANSYFSCDPGEPDDNANNGTTIVPRGTAGRTPWTRTVDLNIAYRPAFVEGLQFKVDVFNVFNSREATIVDEFGEDASGFPAPETYGHALEYQSPRAVRFMVQYDWK